jgi:hypothetical protein
MAVAVPHVITIAVLLALLVASVRASVVVSVVVLAAQVPVIAAAWELAADLARKLVTEVAKAHAMNRIAQTLRKISAQRMAIIASEAPSRFRLIY